MFTIGHAKLTPASDTDAIRFANLQKRFNEEIEFARNLSTGGRYEEDLKNGKIPLTKQGPTKGNPFSKTYWVETEMRKHFPDRDKDEIHASYKDSTKVFKRKGKEDRVIEKSKDLKKKRTNQKKSRFTNIFQNNQVYFERKEDENSLCEIENGQLTINVGDEEIKFLAQWQREPSTLEHGYGARIIKRKKGNQKNKYNDKYHLMVDYDDGLEIPNFEIKDCVIGLDVNKNHIALCIIDKNGNYVDRKFFPYKHKKDKRNYHVEICAGNGEKVIGNTKEHVLSQTIRKVVRFAHRLGLPIVAENLADGSGNGGGYLKGFPKALYKQNLKRQCANYGVPLRLVSAKYTSRIGVHKYLSDSMPEPICAAFVIARRGLFFGPDYTDEMQLSKLEDWEEKKQKIALNRKLEYAYVSMEKPKIKGYTEDQSYFIAECMRNNIPLDKRAKDSYNIYRVLYSGNGSKEALTKDLKSILKIINSNMSNEEIKNEIDIFYASGKSK